MTISDKDFRTLVQKGIEYKMAEPETVEKNKADFFKMLERSENLNPDRKANIMKKENSVN